MSDQRKHEGEKPMIPEELVGRQKSDDAVAGDPDAAGDPEDAADERDRTHEPNDIA